MEQGDLSPAGEQETSKQLVELTNVPPVDTEPVVSVKKNTNMETASLILGILSIVTICCCGIGIVLGGLAITFGCLSRGNQKLSGTALAGIITGAIGLVLGIPAIIFIIFMGILSEESYLYSEAISTMYQVGVGIRGVLG